MDGLAVAGFVCLGLFIGLIVGWFVNQEGSLDAKSVSSIILALGTSAVAFIPLFAPRTIGRELWFYPIALLAGLLVAPFLDIAYDKLYEERKGKR